MKTNATAVQNSEVYPTDVRSRPLATALVLAISSVIFFFGMSSNPSNYDEGLTLTGAMRVAAGQVPHRDFFVDYGPAHFYLLAALFKIFGESVLVERLLYVMICSLIVTVVFLIATRYCSRRVVLWTTLTILFWLFGLGAVDGYVIYPASLLTLIAAATLVPAFIRRISWKRAAVAGAIAGLAGLFRYDSGIGLLGVEICVLAFASFVLSCDFRRWLKAFLAAIWPMLAGFAVIVAPALWFYESRAPFRYFWSDIVGYSTQYYGRGRSLPFPMIHPKTLFDFAIYTPLAIALIAICIGAANILKARRNSVADLPATQRNTVLSGFLFTFGFLGMVMYAKGFVRVTTVHMYLSILPSLLSIGVLFDLRYSLRRPMAVLVSCLMGLSVFAAAFDAIVQAHHFNLQHTWLPAALVAEAKGTLPPEEETWCRLNTPLTKGICFFTDADRIKTIEFLISHRIPGQTLYVGASEHDRSFANDNLTYFATQMLPATHWHDFHPFLQSRKDIQIQMIEELNRNKPPYIVLDAEYAKIREPNESANSTGVTLLDDYIHQTYRQVESFGDLTIWQRI